MANPELAKALLAAASSIDPYSRNRIGNLAGALSAGLGTYQQAQQQGQQQRDIAAIGGQGAERYKALAQYWADKDPAKAKQYLDLAASLSPQKPKAFGQTANINGRLVQLTESGESIDLGPAPAEKPNLPTGVQEYEYAKQQGFKGSLLDYERQKAAAGRAPLAPNQPERIVTIGPDGKPRYELVPSGQLPAGAPPTSKENQKPLPSTAVEAFANNAALLSKIGTAESDVAANPDAFGAKTYLPQLLLNKQSPGGVEARASVFDIGSSVIKDRSGAAVTIAEMPRLAPFIPVPGDSAETISKKLKKLKSGIAQEDEARRASLEYLGFQVPAQSFSDLQEANKPAPKIKRYNPATGRIE